MQGLIDDLVEASRVEAGSIELVKKSEDASAVIEAAMAKAKSTDPAKIAEAFKGLKVEGATGPIEYPADGDHNPNVPLAVVTIKDGKFTFVKTIDPTDVPAH